MRCTKRTSSSLEVPANSKKELPATDCVVEVAMLIVCLRDLHSQETCQISDVDLAVVMENVVGGMHLQPVIVELLDLLLGAVGVANALLRLRTNLGLDCFIFPSEMGRAI